MAVTQFLNLCHTNEQLKKTAMKTKIWVLTTLALFITVIGFASETPKMKVIANDSKEILVSFESATASPIEIMITGKENEILYDWQSETPQTEVNKRFNLSDVGYGTFTISVNHDLKSINREICIKRDEIVIGPSVQLLEPFFCYKNDKVNVSFLNVANKKVFLNVYKDGEHYNGFTLGKDMDIQKCIDFSKADKGKYEIVLTDYFKEHYYSINK